ncbi:unnamed protein product [Rhizophagus irregularis]|nr:unnamed protein product [Rhizophagus irregularis]
MKIVNANVENSFDPTQRLKSSPIPIKFISFNSEDRNCIYCGEGYSEALLCYQYYCQKCFSCYINDITDVNIYLDVYICTADLECSEHKISRTKVPQSIQEYCGNCVRILCFKQIDGHTSIYYYRFDINITLYNKVIESERNCKLCGKSLYQRTDKLGMDEFKLCSDCYLISSELIESTLVKKKISILYLPWWHNNPYCDICNLKLTFISDCQKCCENCFIFYVGCRYCLTTSILFGPTDQSQCKKCKRLSPINSDFDDFLINNNLITLNKLNYLKFEDIVKNINECKRNDKGGYGIIYKATWSRNRVNRVYSVIRPREEETVILKRFKNSKYFLDEIKSIYKCCFKSKKSHIIEIYGFTKDPESKDYILVMKYASGGDLHKHLQENFARITWNKEKLYILHQISMGLETIHNKKFMHRDFHSGNILYDLKDFVKYDRINSYNFFVGSDVSINDEWKIGDLGLSQAINSKSSNNEIYGVIPYIAPEIFKGSKFSKEADIYSFGMIMWELTTGCKPFNNIKHDIQLIYKILDGERPKITEDTPECYANLMKSCWDPDPKKRPSIEVIRSTVELKKIGPKFSEKRHPEAIYTSRPLSALISKCSSIYSSSTISFGKQDANYISELGNNIETKSLSSQNLNVTIQNFSTSLNSSNYISEELKLDINTESLSSQNLNSTIQNFSTSSDSNYISTELEFDINNKCFLSQNLNYTIQKFSTSLKKRGNEEFLNVETHDNSRKRIKTINFNYQ